MEEIQIPLVPIWNKIATTTSTPDGGFLYVGSKTVNYVSKIKENEAPVMKVFNTRQRVKSLDCDPNWADTKYFVTLAYDDSVQIWDFEDGKVKKGHKAHVRTVRDDGLGPPPEVVALCFLKNRSVLSIDSTSIIIYCVSSNTYCKNKRIIKGKDQVSIVRGSPVDENIFAAGTLRGLVVVVDLKSESILYYLRGHDSEITSLSWWTKKTPKTTKSRPKTYPMAGDTTGIDDIFDIYNYQYLDDEFGAPAAKKVASDDEEQNTTVENEKDSFDNSNFNFIEECQNLKDEMEKRMAKNNGTFDQSTSTEAVESSKGQVTLKDCQYPLVRDLSETSYSGPSERSLDVSHLSDEDSYDDDDDDAEARGTGKDLNKSTVSATSQNKTQDIYLATGSRELVVWIWNVNTGSSVERIQLKGGPQSSPNTIIDLAWMDDKLLVGNPRAGEVTVWASKKNDENKISFEKEIRKSANGGVVNFCKLPNCEIIWTISHYREIVCEDLANNKVLAKYSCAPSNISSMQERQDDMNKVAFGCVDRRIGILNTSNMTSTNIIIDNFSNKIESSVLSLGWCQDDRFLAFGTMEGRIGVLDTEKTSCPPVIMRPFYGKPVYAIEWSGKHIFACSNEKIYAYPWNNKHQEAILVDTVDSASAFAIRENILVVGRQNGNIALYKRENITHLKFELKSEIPFASNYVTKILFNPFKQTRIACSSNSNKLITLNISDDDKLEILRCLIFNEPNSGIPSIKWNFKNENILLSCGFNGTVRVWDLSNPNGEELIFLKQFDCPMLCGIFSPIDENIIIAAGKTTSIEMFNYRAQKNSDIGKKFGRYKERPLGNVQWGSKLIGDVATKDLRKEKRRRRARSIEGRGTENVIEKLKDMDINSSDSKPPDTIPSMPSSLMCKNQATVLHLAAKEINKYAIPCTVTALKELEGILDESNENSPCGRKILHKFFGNRTEVQTALNEELTNHRHSHTKSIGEILIPQIGQNLKEEIVSRIQSKKLTDVHVALAPTISYQFWKSCCIAYASQLLEIDFTLQAIPYLLACHKTEECINYLIRQNFYREAWVIAKLHREESDAIFEDILKKWIDYLETTGNFEGAILLCVHTKRFQQGINILLKRGELTANHELILELLNKQLQ